MVHDAPGDPSRPTHQEIIEEEHTQLGHAHDVLPRCRCIVEIAQEAIDKCIFPDGSEVRHVLDAIMTDARETLMYQRQRWRMGVDEAEEL